MFATHIFTKYTNSTGQATYYDPSYGVTYTGPNNFELNALAGYGVFDSLDSLGNRVYRAKESDHLHLIQFIEF
ncbi:MAG TPA: hypothetical protein VIW67_14750 [Terriglobales bacterium]